LEETWALPPPGIRLTMRAGDAAEASADAMEETSALPPSANRM
jgi:hypothetical protein